MTPASISRAAMRYVPGSVEAKRNQPVSVATAAKSGRAICGESGTPRASAASNTNRPVASASVFLNSLAPRSSSLTWWSITALTARLARITSAIGPNWTHADVFEDDNHLPVRQLLGGNIDSQLLVSFRLVEKPQVRRHGEAVDDRHVLSQPLQNEEHGQLAAQAVAIGPDVRSQQEPLVGTNEFDEAGPVNHKRD